MKRISIFCLLLIFAGSIWAQGIQDEKGARKEKVEAMKVAFLTQKMDLSSKEAQVFWPIYNEFEQKLEQIRKSRKKEAQLASEAIDKLSDKEAESLINGEFTQRQNELDLQKEYHEKFKKILPLKKLAKLYVAEQEFKRELLKKIKEQKK